jgi:hypothetical protein
LKLEEYKERFTQLNDKKRDWLDGNTVAQDLLIDASGNHDVVLKILRKIKSNPDFRVLMASSVGSVAKYIANYCSSGAGATIETLILYGHGGADSMNVGLGRVGLQTHAEIEELEGDDQEDAKKLRRYTAADPKVGKNKPGGNVREIDVHSTDRWKAAFLQLAPYVQVRAKTQCFHVFLMACELAGHTRKPYKDLLLPRFAKGLKQIFNIDVCVAAPTKGVTDKELFQLIDDLKSVCKKLSTGNEVTLNDIPLQVEWG